MDVLSIATVISALALGYVAAPGIRSAALARMHSVPPLPKRVLPPALPASPRSTRVGGVEILELARYRRYEAMGIADEFIPAGRWRCD
ncbi:hypothetical protein [Rhodanobacter denitrificans]|uniref:hypothetical protein n=1 Tax=Rhodanobacter denitrificans TaxID=666685 RepID=UPI001F1F6FE8|nr:hypothetical protein [Rhodanobacter denitrificans]UJJ60605.1 hypothetical protein LRK55_19415 [Rhodanobacter denitrificans]